MPKDADYWTQFASCSLVNSSFQGLQISMASITNILPQFCFRTLLVVTIFLALVEGSVTKCSRPQKCGHLTVDYAFAIKDSACIAHPGFEIACKENSSLGRGLLPFLPTPSGDFQILNISLGSLMINSTSLKAMCCDGTESWLVLDLPTNGIFTISDTNVLAVIGCESNGSFLNAQNSEITSASCQAGCVNHGKPKFCNFQGCCSVSIAGDSSWINFTIGGFSYLDFPGKCGFSTILEPDTFSTTEPREIGSGQYGLKLDWTIVGHSGGFITNPNCSTASSGCSEHANCRNWRNGYICECQKGYAEDGYSNGSGCTGTIRL
eukprot:Gb_23522 [translate_table: standard]